MWFSVGENGLHPSVTMGLGMVRMCKCCDRSAVVQVRFWTFRESGSAKCVMRRGVGLPGSDATSVMLFVTRFPTTLFSPVPPSPPTPRVLWGGHLLSREVQVLRLGALGLDTFHRGTMGMGMSPLRGVVLAPVLAGMRWERREKLVSCCKLCLLQTIMSPEDFAKYQVLVAPKP